MNQEQIMFDEHYQYPLQNLNILLQPSVLICLCYRWIQKEVNWEIDS